MAYTTNSWSNSIETPKRVTSSRVLLAVFLSMLILSSVHVHEADGQSAAACAECIHHHCGGHLGQQAASSHTCVLCQFLSLPFVVVTVAAVVLYNKVVRRQPVSGQCGASVCASGIVGLRAPPAV